MARNTGGQQTLFDRVETPLMLAELIGDMEPEVRLSHFNKYPAIYRWWYRAGNAIYNTIVYRRGVAATRA